MEIPLELIGQGMIHLNEQLKLKNQDLESTFEKTKRQLADAMKRIREQEATIEEQNRTIANLKRNYKLASKLHSPIIERKKPR
jgi:chromosome segregation ATPase